MTVDFICSEIFLPSGVLQCMLRIHPYGDIGLEGEQGWMGQEEGRVISSCKDSKKIDEVNTIGGHYLIYLCK